MVPSAATIAKASPMPKIVQACTGATSKEPSVMERFKMTSPLML
jgi:hypothetical protein